MSEPTRDAPGTRPNAARMYDYYLGGAHNFAVDREVADRVIATFPGVVALSQTNRHFLRAAVRHCLDLGIRQFLDLGSGIPTAGAVHEIAHAHDPEARVVYVDNEAVAVAHSTEILRPVRGAGVVDADLRDADAVLGHPTLTGLLDLDRPVALLMLAVLQFVPDADDPASITARYRARLAPGSVLALTHLSADHPEHPELADEVARVCALYRDAEPPLFARDRPALRALLDGFPVGPDALVELGTWAPAGAPNPAGGYGVVTDPLPG